MTEQQNDKTVILVDFSGEGGLQQVSRGDQAEKALAEKSEKAIDRAMSTIQAMATRVRATVAGIEVVDRPSEIAVTFGITLSGELGALVAKTKAEASVEVTMTWEQEPKPFPILPTPLAK